MRALSSIGSGIVAAALVGLLGVTATPAQASPSGTFVSKLNIANDAISPFLPSGSFGTLTITLVNPTTATATFTASANSQFQYAFIDSSIADLNVNASSFTASGFTGTPLNGSFSAFACANTGCDGGAGNVNGFGVFNQTVNAFDGYKFAQSQVIYTVTNNSGTWASAADVLVGNASMSGNFDAAAHIAVCDIRGGLTCSPGNGALATGFAAETGGGSVGVPEPAGIAVFGLGVLAVAFLHRRRAVQ